MDAKQQAEFFIDAKSRPMLVTNGTRTIEVYRSQDILPVRGPMKFYAHTHCWCGSTMSSGEYLESMTEAVALACEGMDEHQDKQHKGVRS